MAMREEARAKVRPRTDKSGVRGYRNDVDKGLKQLRIKSAQGGDGKAKRFKSELNYLINNYLPKYDARIEQLIDGWRRSGDPEYDPMIRIKYRNARRAHMSKSNPY
jgi:hypothetical protein